MASLAIAPGFAGSLETSRDDERSGVRDGDLREGLELLPRLFRAVDWVLENEGVVDLEKDLNPRLRGSGVVPDLIDEKAYS